MNGRRWNQSGFWVLLGLAGGMLLANLTNAQFPGGGGNQVSASGSATRYDEHCMVTGASFDREVDIVWLLDYRGGRLHCIVVGRNGKLSSVGEIDLLQQFEMEGGARSKPHFMMVTGRNAAASTDLLYLAETTSGQVLCVAPPGANARAAGQGATAGVIDRFKYRREGAVRAQ